VTVATLNIFLYYVKTVFHFAMKLWVIVNKGSFY